MSVENKAKQYLTEGKVKVVEFAHSTQLFHVQGTDPYNPYTVRFMGSYWDCSCPARIELCAHVVACRLICNTETHARTLGSSENSDELDALLSSFE